MRLLTVEIRRALHRRSVWWLLLVAAAGIVAMGTIAFISSAGTSGRVLVAQHHPAVLRHWWSPRGDDSPLLLGTIFLFMGAVIGGATATGGEWRAGTLPTLLTWEPRRVRFALHRLAACAICAAAIGIALQALLMAALLPAVLVNGVTDGIDGAWVVGLLATVARASLLAAVAAVLSASLGLAFRNTAAVLGLLWVWLSVAESMARGLKPWLTRYLLTDNVARVVTWFDHSADVAPSTSRSPAIALVLLCVYLVVIVSLTVGIFSRSDAVAA